MNKDARATDSWAGGRTLLTSIRRLRERFGGFENGNFWQDQLLCWG